MKLADAALCAGFSLALPIGQTLFKFAAEQNAKMSGPLVLRLATNAPLIGAFAWYGLTALFWFYILTRVPAVFGLRLFDRGVGPSVLLVAWLVFKEPLDWRFAVGYLLMLAGFAVIMQGQRAVG